MRDTAKPIREGEEKASVVLDLGDLIVTRTWKGDSTALDVRGKDGTRYTSPQTMLDALDAKRDASLAAAKFPVDGLGFTDDGVTFKGVPFGQASSAEQITVSLAMAMALNPKLRVIRILDGSLLDPDSMQTIAAMAGENDYQVWVERVSDTSGVGVVIEDGEVQS
jgi:hypothetical protein